MCGYLVLNANQYRYYLIFFLKTPSPKLYPKKFQGKKITGCAPVTVNVP